MSAQLPPCGIYKTTRALTPPIEAGVLVYFHNHSDGGGPVVHLPVSNTHNRWSYDPVAHAVAPDAVDSLQPLKGEGFYRLREHFHPDRERIVPPNTLVQLGYNRAAEPLIFFPRPVEGKNQLEFPTRGMMVSASIYELLEPLDVRGPIGHATLH